MARARNIKPGFFKNEDLAECSPWARLCFAGLWVLADRSGRLEDRPRRIKGELFAFDSIEVEPLLCELERHGFLVRYRNSDGAFIQISKFSTHQTPHYSEKESVIKPPDFQESDDDEDGETPGGLQEDSRKTPVIKRGSQPPDSLIPDSLIPDSLIPEEKPSKLSLAPALPPEDRQPKALGQAPPEPWEAPDCPHLDVLALWAEVLPAMPQHLPSQWRGARADHLRTRWRETATEKRWPTAAEGIEYFRKLFAYCGKSAFLTGRTPQHAPGKRPFRKKPALDGLRGGPRARPSEAHQFS